MDGHVRTQSKVVWPVLRLGPMGKRLFALSESISVVDVFHEGEAAACGGEGRKQGVQKNVPVY